MKITAPTKDIGNSPIAFFNIEDLRNVIKELLNDITPPPPPPVPNEVFINTKEVAEMLQISTVTVWDWKRNGKLPFYRIGSKVLFKKNEILATMNKIEKRSFA